MKFGTVINCMDGRVQIPVQKYLKSNFNIEYFDTANEAGPIHVLTGGADRCRLFSLKEQIKISVEAHGSRFIAVVGHHDCAGNPVSREAQEFQIKDVIGNLKKDYGEEILYVGLYVNKDWEVEETMRINP